MKKNKNQFTTIGSVDVEEKIKEAYEDKNGIPFSTKILNKQVHKEYYQKYHRRYSYTFKNKQSPNQVPNYLSSHRLPLVDRTNYQFSSSTVVTTPSINEHSQQNFVNLSI